MKLHHGEGESNTSAARADWRAATTDAATNKVDPTAKVPEEIGKVPPSFTADPANWGE